jgi:hypothetical protein
MNDKTKPINNRQITAAIIILVGWILLAITIWTIFPGPGEWQWIAYIPGLAFVITVLVSFIGIVLSYKTNLFKPVICCVNGQTYFNCPSCQYSDIKENPIPGSIMPIMKCKEKNRQVFSMQKVPRWCPHARR